MGSIEEEIRQKFFSDEHVKMIINLMYTGNWVNSCHIKWFKPYGLSPQQYNILRILRGQHPNPVSIGSIASRMLDRNSNASRLVDKLVTKQLIHRTVSESDRRQVDVLISKQGLELLKEIDVLLDNYQSMFKTITPEEAHQLNNLLDKLRG